MTIKTYGVAGSMDTTHFARVLKDSCSVPDGHGLVSGGAVTKLAAARTVRIAGPASIVTGGALIESDANVDKVGDANSGSNPRIDLVCAQTDWAGNVDTAGSFVIVKGLEASSPADPDLVQDPGVKWQEPIARYTMQGGVISGLVPVGAGAIETVVVDAAGWSQPTIAPLTLEKRNGIVYFGGRMTRTSSALSDTADFNQTVIIPAGFRPAVQKNVMITSDQADASTPTIGHMIIRPDGQARVHIFIGSVATGQTMRVTDTSWIGA